MNFVLPPRTQVGVLDPEIAGEGQKVINSEGEQVNWQPPPVKPVTPDWSEIKSIKKYFGRTGYSVWPAWLYHPTEEPRLLKNAAEAAELGVKYREATVHERGMFGVKYVWDFQEGGWGPTPHKLAKFDPSNPGQGKHYIAPGINPIASQHALLAELIPQLGAAVAAAVAQALKTAGNAPASTVDPGKIATAAVTKVVAASQLSDEPAESTDNALTSSLDEDEEREIWRAEAERKGIKVDKRWKIGRLKAEIDKAA